MGRAAASAGLTGARIHNKGVKSATSHTALFFEKLEASMANDHFMPQFAELVGSWGSLETNTGESALTATSGSDKVRCEWDEGDLASDLNDDTPILYWSQLHTIVDSIVEEFVKNAIAGKTKAGAALSQGDFVVVADAAKAAITLPAGATENEGPVTRAQACKLIEVVNAGCVEIIKSKIDPLVTQAQVRKLLGVVSAGCAEIRKSKSF